MNKKNRISLIIIVLHIIAYIIVCRQISSEEIFKIVIPSLSSMISLIIAVQVSSIRDKNKTDVKFHIIPSSNQWQLDLNVIVNNISESIITIDSISCKYYLPETYNISVEKMISKDFNKTLTVKKEILDSFWLKAKFIFPRNFRFVIYYTSTLLNKQEKIEVKVHNPFSNRKLLIKSILNKFKNKSHG